MNQGPSHPCVSARAWSPADTDVAQREMRFAVQRERLKRRQRPDGHAHQPPKGLRVIHGGF
jgi:hypothetical protein